jgi:2-polyprenyl-6-methoxyphenol hydroxylase-like FAD-dependent oxidoreductase
MANPRSSAIVVGASMSGLVAARALSNHFDRVTVIERDVLMSGAEVRKGVPQAAHAHGLLASGFRVLDEYFPGLIAELETLGAPIGDVVGNFLWFQYGRWKLRYESGLRGITVSRPCLESAVRRHVAALRNVTFLDGMSAVKPNFDAVAARVTGVGVRPRDGRPETTLNADLVIDATGRGSQSPKCLEEWGFGQPPTTTVTVNVGYSTRIFERRPGDFFNSMGAIVAGTPPDNTRLAAVLAAEGNRWVITLGGALGDYPPADEMEWTRWAASLPVPVVHELVSTARPLTDIVTFRFPANQRRLYETMKRFPAGYLVVGDAVCSFNPIYGQGMSVAAMEAKALDTTLAEGRDHLADRFYAKARKIVDIPWTIATGEDLRCPQVEGTRPPGFHLINRYMERVHAAAGHDPIVCRKFFEVLNLLSPPTSLMAPAIAWRVLGRRAPAGQGSPWSLAPHEPESTVAVGSGTRSQV